ncbi:MAG: zinc-binding dehydrogenase [Rhodospirillales bacterium]|nr:zinc-binding dehydrogenase [Rhodospirillales bacterium]
MKAVLCTRFGTPGELVLADVDDPVAGPGEVVTAVKAVGLNFYDTLIVAGRYQKKPPFPFSPGGEFAGVVESVGAGVSGFRPGDRVIGYVTHGAARERMAAPADKLIRLDADLSFDRAAALTIIYGTAMHALRDRAQIKRGETLAVLGAAGGVGLAAVELGKLMGARVLACASTDDKLAFARAHGADETVNYTTRDLRDALKRLGGEHGIDVIFDPIGDRFSEAALRAIAWQGRHLVVGFAAGEIPKLPLNLTLLKGCSVMGVYFGDWVVRERQAYQSTIVELARLAAEGKLSCHVDRAYPLAEFPQALKSLSERRAMGKVIVRP